MMEPVMLAVLLVVLVTAIGTDLRFARIPNWLTFPAMGFALIGHVWSGGMSEGLFSLAGLGAGLGLFLLIYRIHRTGYSRQFRRRNCLLF